MTLALLLKITSVFFLASVELWLAIPAGLALKIGPLAVSLICSAGALFGSAIVCLAGAPFRAWFLGKFRKKTDTGRPNWVDRIWKDYGVIGLGVLAPLITGAPLGTAIGIALGARWSRILFWISLGTIAWTFLFTYGAVWGFSAIFKH